MFEKRFIYQNPEGPSSWKSRVFRRKEAPEAGERVSMDDAAPAQKEEEKKVRPGVAARIKRMFGGRNFAKELAGKDIASPVEKKEALAEATNEKAKELEGERAEQEKVADEEAVMKTEMLSQETRDMLADFLGDAKNKSTEIEKAVDEARKAEEETPKVEPESIKDKVRENNRDDEPRLASR